MVQLLTKQPLSSLQVRRPALSTIQMRTRFSLPLRLAQRFRISLTRSIPTSLVISSLRMYQPMVTAISCIRQTTTAKSFAAGDFSGGTDTVTASSFRLQATTGGDAGGTIGNSTKVVFSSGATTEAEYDADSNELRVSVADGATVNQVATAIDTDGTFQLVPGQTLKRYSTVQR